MKRNLDPESVRQLPAFSLTIAASLVLLFVPLYAGASVTDEGLGHVSHSTLLQAAGPSISGPLLVPVALTGLPVLLRGRSRKYAAVATTVALAIFVGIGSASIGWFYLPALTAAVAALVGPSTGRGTHQTGPA